MQLYLHNEGEQLAPPHMLRVGGMGVFASGAVMHLPPDTPVSNYLASGGVYGPLHRMQFPAGDTDWWIEFATVEITFGLHGGSCPLSTTIMHYMTIANGGTAHLPPGGPVKLQANICGWKTPMIAETFAAGESSYSWELKLNNSD